MTASERSFIIAPSARIGYVHLSVADLEKQVDFYRKFLGLKLHRRDDNTAAMGAGGEDLLRLTELRNARRIRGTTGLYHFAILFPSRRELARAVARLFALRYPNHPTDHILTKTTYLDDPEGNNIELYADTPEDGTFAIVNETFVARRVDGTPSDGREPLDVKELFAELTAEDPLDEPAPADARLGHIHLYVADLDASLGFYHRLLGFDNMGIARNFRMGMVSAGGYHHHIGFNTWLGEGSPPTPPGTLGMRYFTVLVPESDLEQIETRAGDAGVPVEHSNEGLTIHDPSRIVIVLQKS